jgi:hypothetical protein
VVVNPFEGDPAAADDSSREPRMIGDFDGSANPLWALYGKEAKSHDEARIQNLKDDMDGVLIFVRPYFVLPITDSVIIHRPVYFPPLSRRLFLIANRTCKLARQTK